MKKSNGEIVNFNDNTLHFTLLLFVFVCQLLSSHFSFKHPRWQLERASCRSFGDLPAGRDFALQAWFLATAFPKQLGGPWWLSTSCRGMDRASSMAFCALCPKPMWKPSASCCWFRWWWRCRFFLFCFWWRCMANGSIGCWFVSTCACVDWKLCSRFLILL